MALLHERETQSTAHPFFVPGMLLAGIALVVGGEFLCFVGPESHARLRDTACHTIFYTGVTCVVLGDIFRWTSRR